MISRDFSDPKVKLVEVTPEMERKDRERNSSTSSGLFASWQGTPNDLDPALVPPDKLKMLEETRKREHARSLEVRTKEPDLPAVIGPGVGAGKEDRRCFHIPSQAMLTFRKFLTDRTQSSINFSREEAGTFRDLLGQLKTPTRLSDAKAIIQLSDQLDEWIGDQ